MMKTDIVSKHDTDIPKLEEYQNLIATKDNIKEGDLFLDSSRENLLIISEIEDEEKGNRTIVLYTVNLETFQKEINMEEITIYKFQLETIIEAL